MSVMLGQCWQFYVGPMSYCSLARRWPNMLGLCWYNTVCLFVNVGTTLFQHTKANAIFRNVGPTLDLSSKYNHDVGPTLVQRFCWNANVGTTLFQRTNANQIFCNVGPTLDLSSKYSYYVGLTWIQSWFLKYQWHNYSSIQMSYKII